MTDVKYTRGPEAGPMSSAAAQGSRDVLVVASPAAVRAASPELRQRLAVLAGAPWPSVLAIATKDLPVVVGAAPHPQAADDLRHRILQEHGLETTVLAPPGGLALAFGGLAGGLVAIGLAAICWLFVSSTAALLVLLASLGLLVVGAGALRNWTSQRRVHQEAAATHDSACRSLPAPQVAQLSELRALSLHEDVPVEAQVDLWTQVEHVERALLAGSGDAAVLSTGLEDLRRALTTRSGGPDGATSADKLRATAARIAASVRESRGSGAT